MQLETLGLELAGRKALTLVKAASFILFARV